MGLYTCSQVKCQSCLTVIVTCHVFFMALSASVCLHPVPPSPAPLLSSLHLPGCPDVASADAAGFYWAGTLCFHLLFLQRLWPSDKHIKYLGEFGPVLSLCSHGTHTADIQRACSSAAWLSTDIPKQETDSVFMYVTETLFLYPLDSGVLTSVCMWVHNIVFLLALPELYLLL